jgi:hypothetical protein
MMKLTNKIALEIALNAIENSALANWSYTQGEDRLEVSKAEAMDKLAKMMEQLDKKANAEKKPTQRQMDAEQEAQTLLVELREAGNAMTVSDMIAELPSCKSFSNQKVSALIRKLGTAVERIEEKRKAYFKAVA